MAPAPAFVTVPTSRCPKCDSTERTPYFGFTDEEHAGIDEKGKPPSPISFADGLAG